MDAGILASIGTGAASAAGFQALKGPWNRWITILFAMLVAFGAVMLQGGSVDDGVVAVLGALSTHSVLLANTPIGNALKWELLPMLLTKVAEVAAKVGESGKTPGAGGTT